MNEPKLITDQSPTWVGDFKKSNLNGYGYLSKEQLIELVKSYKSDIDKEIQTTEKLIASAESLKECCEYYRKTLSKNTDTHLWVLDEIKKNQHREFLLSIVFTVSMVACAIIYCCDKLVWMK